MNGEPTRLESADAGSTGDPQDRQQIGPWEAAPLDALDAFVVWLEKIGEYKAAREVEGVRARKASETRKG